MGWAVFDQKVLIRAGLIVNKDIIESAVLLYQSYKPKLLVVEKPKIYPIEKWKGDPNDLIDVAITAGVVIGVFKDSKIDLVLPHTWKGQRPKDVDNQYTLSLLTKIEQGKIGHYPKTKMHNVIDAIGLGLWKIGRR